MLNTLILKTMRFLVKHTHDNRHEASGSKRRRWSQKWNWGIFLMIWLDKGHCYYFDFKYSCTQLYCQPKVFQFLAPVDTQNEITTEWCIFRLHFSQHSIFFLNEQSVFKHDRNIDVEETVGRSFTSEILNIHYTETD